MDLRYIYAAKKLLDLNQGQMSYLFPLDRDGELFLVTDLNLSKARIPRGFRYDSKRNLYCSTKGHAFALPVVLLEDVKLQHKKLIPLTE